MGDRIGALTLPVQVGGMSARLEVLLAFCKAVLISAAQSAWAGVAPLEPNEVVASTFAKHPRYNPFVEARELPALFASETKGTFDTEPMGDGYERGASVIQMWWLFPPAFREHDQDPAPPALARVLSAALRDARHPAYVHADDQTAPEAVKVSFALPGADTVYEDADLDGTIGAGEWPTPGRVLLTKSAGTWDVSKPILVTVALDGGAEHVEEVYFTSPADAEAVEATWIGARVVSIAVPGGQTGTLSVGSALAPACEHGSPIRDRMSVRWATLANWERKELVVEVRPPAPPIRYDGVLFEIAIEEIRDRTADALGYEQLDATGYQGAVKSIDGGYSAEVFEV